MTSADTQSCTAKMAQPEPEVAGPTDEELADTYWDAWHKHLDRTNSVLHSVGLRAVLARYGHQPAPAAAGEVGELVEWLREQADNERGCEFDECEGAVFDAADKLTRAADLLEQRHPAPVPIAERLPGPEDCDEEGLCWWFSPADPSAGTFGVASCWVLRKHEPEDDFRTHWLSATALPVPGQGEI